MSKFNVGDKVICIDREGLESDPLELGKVYEVISTHEFYISIDIGGGKIMKYYPRRFKLVAKQPEQECPYCIIEELSAQVENLEELISEQAAHIRDLESDSQAQQAECYRRLTNLLLGHESFQETDGSLSDDLAATIEVLQDAYDRLPNRFR